jgi:hypothetical protein
MFKSTLDRVLVFSKNIPALVNLWVINMNGKNNLKKKEEPMSMKLPKHSKMRGVTSKYPKYNNAKASYHIQEVFVVKNIVFFSDRSCFFSATVF